MVVVVRRECGVVGGSKTEICDSESHLFWCIYKSEIQNPDLKIKLRGVVSE